jgi:hypothetical protein
MPDSWKLTRTAHFSDPLAGRLCGTARASTRCARRCPNPTDLPPCPDSQTGRPAATDTDPPCSSHPPPPAQRFFPLLRTPILPPLLVLPQIDHPAEPLFPAPSGSPPARAPDAPASTRGAGIPLEDRLPPRPVLGSRIEPSEFLRCRDPERHFRTRAAFGVRPLAGAVEERHAALPLAQLVALGRHTVTGRLTPPKTASTATGPPTTGSTSATGPTRKPCWRRRGKRWRRNWRRTHRWWWAWTIRSCPRLAAGSPGRRGGAIPRGRLSKCRCAGRSGCCSFPPPCRWAGRGRPA